MAERVPLFAIVGPGHLRESLARVTSTTGRPAGRQMAHGLILALPCTIN